MRVGILGKKVGMTEMFDENGTLTPVTVIDTTGCTITQIKTPQTDGYTAIQLGIGSKKPQNVNKPLSGHFKKAKTAPLAKLKEMRIEDESQISGLEVGAQIQVAAAFQKGDYVDVTGTTQGKGYAGVMKRHNFAGAKASHGVHEYFRHGGSIGATTFPGKVWKNQKMSGQMGNVTDTTMNLTVFDVRPEDNLLLIKGAVPGHKSSVVMVRSAMKKPVKDGERTFVSAPASTDKPAEDQQTEAPQDK